MKRIIYAFILAILVVNLDTPLLFSAVDVERATRSTDVLDIGKKVKEKFKTYPEKPTGLETTRPIEKKEEKKFFVKSIKLIGYESFPPEDFYLFIKEFENKEVSLSDLETLANQIQEEYFNRGVISYVFVPEQDILDASVTLQVIESKFGLLDIQDCKYFSKERLKYYWSLKPDEVLKYNKLSRNIQLMNKNPDRSVKAILHAGVKEKTTDVTLTPATNFPMHIFSMYDNEGSTPTGKSRTSFGGRHNNFLGLDDMLISGYTFGKSFHGSYVYHNIPVSPDGTYLLYGYSDSYSNPLKEYAESDIISDFKDTSISLHQDIFSGADYIGEVFVGFDAKDKIVKVLSQPYNKDRQRIFQVGANFIHRGQRNIFTISPILYQGVNAFGASKKNDPFVSRGAKSDFTKFTLTFEDKHLLPFNAQLNYKFDSQVSSTKLTPQEEFSLGGIDSVRGYPNGDYIADYGLVNSVELLTNAFFLPPNWHIPYAEAPLREQINPLIFMDYGYGRRRGPLDGEKKSDTLFSVGCGLRIMLFNQALLRLEWGFPLGDKTITESGRSHFHFAVTFQEKLPEEIARIKELRKKAKEARAPSSLK